MKLYLKNIFLLTAGIFYALVAKCQPKEPDSLVAARIPFITDLKLKKKEKILVYRYGHIVIKDMRQDTSKMGYLRLDTKSRPRPITFPKAGTGYLNEIFNNAIKPSQQLDTLIIVLNDIWFNETITEAELAHKLLLGAEKLVSSCFLNADFFMIDKNGYQFIGSYDSVVNKKGEWLPNNCDKLLEKVATSLLKEADSLLTEANAHKYLYTDEQFDSLLTSRFPYPILKTDKPIKGVYLSYNDFLSNNPSLKDYTIISDKNRAIDYQGRKIGDSAWGYCDGKNIYMHIGATYYRLYKSQNTFELIGPAAVEIVNSFFEKAFRVATDFYSSPAGSFSYYTPIKVRSVDPSPLFDPSIYNIQYFKFYHMNMKNGYLN